MHGPASKLKFAQDIGKPKIGNLHSVGRVLVKHSQEILDKLRQNIGNGYLLKTILRMLED